eukprot:8915762-Pyramimonas_sp.AAC.1
MGSKREAIGAFSGLGAMPVAPGYANVYKSAWFVMTSAGFFGNSLSAGKWFGTAITRRWRLMDAFMSWRYSKLNDGSAGT